MRTVSIFKKVKTFRECIFNLEINVSVPWRREKDIKKILVGELLLIRTNYKQASKVYTEFFKVFPEGNVPLDKESEALKILEKAGLKHRAKGILKVLNILNEKNPDEVNLKILKKLPYVSDYIASVVSFFLGQQEFIYPDANIIRVIERYFGLKGKDKTHPSSKQLGLLVYIISRFLNKKDKRKFVLNLLDFGLTICLPRKPLCNLCCLYDKHCCFIEEKKQ
jgi:A/G-specific adenine glycosylase